MDIQAWSTCKPCEPMVLERRAERPSAGQVTVEVAGCGVCHTDLGFFFDRVPTRHPLPLTLGHEISGRVVETGAGAEGWLGRAVIVPAVIPCGDCAACRDGRGSICPRQVFPGNDVHGGFATHVVVPALGLCPVPEPLPRGLELSMLSVIADAVSTPYQAIRRSGLRSGDVAIFVGAGGVGGFGVQIAAALGAAVVAIDPDSGRTDRLAAHGLSLALDPSALDFKALRKAVRDFAAARGVPTWRQLVFETSGTPQGQATAFGLLGHGGYLSIVGFTPETVTVRLSNLMALDARVEGNWGCLPALYPEALALVLEGRVDLPPFVERRPLGSINQTFHDVHARAVNRRVVLVPET